MEAFMLYQLMIEPVRIAPSFLVIAVSVILLGRGRILSLINLSTHSFIKDFK